MPYLLPRSLRTLAISAGFLLAHSVTAADPGVGEWTTFGNGPSHSGYYPKRIGSASFTAGWTKTFPTQVNQLAVSGDTIYATTNGYFNAGMRAFAMKVSDGSEKWSFPLADGFSVNPPTYANGRVYFQRGNHGSDTHLWCLDAVSGTLKFAAPHAAQWERYAAPTVADGGAFVNGGYYGGMYGFDATTGVQRFFIDNLAQQSGWTPSFANGVVYSCVAGQFTAYDPRTGSQLWSRNLGTTTTGISTYWSEGNIPVISEGKAAVVGGGRVLVLDLVTRTPIWSKSGNYYGTPAFAEGKIYAFLGNELKCYSAADGALVGSYPVTGAQGLTNQPLVTKDLVFASAGASTSVFDRATFALRQTLPGGELSYASGRLYLVKAEYGSPATLATYTVVPEEADPPAEPLPPNEPPQSRPNPNRPLGPTNVAWVDSMEAGGIAYFLFATPAKLERYELATGAWLAPISLPDGPKGFTVTANTIYVSFGTNISKFSIDGTTETPLTSTANSIKHLFELNGKLYLGNEYGSGFFIVDPTFGNFLGAKNFSYSQGGISVAPSKNKFFGRSTGVSPSDILGTSLNSDGSFGAQVDSPYHGSYPGGTRTFVMPGEGRVVDDSGIIYSTGDLSYLGSFAGSFNDMTFANGSSILLRGNNQLVAYSPALAETGRKSISANQQRIYVGGEFVHSFARLDGRGVVGSKTALADLVPQNPGPGIDPTTLAYTPDAIEQGGDTVYLLSKLHQSVFRWSIAQQKYLASIPLTETPQYMAYAANLNRIYLSYAGGRIGVVNLNAGLTESNFANLPQSAVGIQAAGDFLFAADPSGAWATHYTFTPEGTLISSVDWNYVSREYTWSAANRRMYFLRDDTSPNDLLWESIDTEGKIAQEGETPYHGDYVVRHPIRVAPDGSVVLLGNGDVYNALNLTRLGALPVTQPPASNSWPYTAEPAVIDGGWLNDVLFTVSPTYAAGASTPNGGRIQSWNAARQQSAIGTLPGVPKRLFALTNKLLAISMVSGKPKFSLLNSDLQDATSQPPQPHPNPERPLGNTSVAWIDSMEAGGITYFLFDNPAKIERYDLATGSWLNAISLPDGPKKFTVSSNAIYVSFGAAISKFPLNGSTETSLATAGGPIETLFELNGKLYVGIGSSFSAIDPTWGTVVHTKTFDYTQRGVSVAVSINKFFGRTVGVSPADILGTSINTDGSLGLQNDSPHHGTYPDAARTYVMPGESQVVDNAGSIHSTGNLSYAGAFPGGAFDDIDFHGSSCVVLRGNQLLIAYSSALAETGRKTIAAGQLRIQVAGNFVHSFSLFEGRGVTATKTALAELVLEPDPDPDPVPIDFAAFTGTYFASLSMDSGGEGLIGGILKLTFDARGNASGNLRIGRKPVPFRATFDAFGNASVTVKLNGQIATIVLKLAMGEQGPILTGSVRTSNSAYTLIGARAQQTQVKPGRYLFLLTDSSRIVRDDCPPVIGHGAMIVSRKGTAVINGRLLFGGAVAQGASVLEDGSVVLNLMTQSGTNLITGMVSPADLPGCDWSGSPRWAKRAAPARASYPQAIDSTVEFSATEYERDLPPLTLPPDKGVTIILESGDLEEPVFSSGTLYSSGLVLTSFQGAASSAYINVETGFMRGYFIHPASGEPTLFEGIVNRKLNQAQGSFLGPQHGGQARIVPGRLIPNLR